VRGTCGGIRRHSVTRALLRNTPRFLGRLMMAFIIGVGTGSRRPCDALLCCPGPGWPALRAGLRRRIVVYNGSNPVRGDPRVRDILKDFVLTAASLFFGENLPISRVLAAHLTASLPGFAAVPSNRNCVSWQRANFCEPPDEIPQLAVRFQQSERK